MEQRRRRPSPWGRVMERLRAMDSSLKTIASLAGVVFLAGGAFINWAARPAKAAHRLTTQVDTLSVRVRINTEELARHTQALRSTGGRLDVLEQERRENQIFRAFLGCAEAARQQKIEDPTCLRTYLEQRSER